MLTTGTLSERETKKERTLVNLVFSLKHNTNKSNWNTFTVHTQWKPPDLPENDLVHYYQCLHSLNKIFNIFDLKATSSNTVLICTFSISALAVWDNPLFNIFVLYYYCVDFSYCDFRDYYYCLFFSSFTHKIYWKVCLSVWLMFCCFSARLKVYGQILHICKHVLLCFPTF